MTRTNSENELPFSALFQAPLAWLGLRVKDELPSEIEMLAHPPAVVSPPHPATRELMAQLTAYFEEPDWRFDLPLALSGTPFQQKVWRALRDIPPGAPLTYGELARQLGTSPRAVGNACRANPLPIVIPCHRVIGRHGLTGYMGSRGQTLIYKQWLLAHEARKSLPAWPA